MFNETHTRLLTSVINQAKKLVSTHIMFTNILNMHIHFYSPHISLSILLFTTPLSHFCFQLLIIIEGTPDNEITQHTKPLFQFYHMQAPKLRFQDLMILSLTSQAKLELELYYSLNKSNSNENSYSQGCY